MKQLKTGDALKIRPRTRSSIIIWILLLAASAAHAQAAPGVTNFARDTAKPLEYGLIVQGGKGITDERDGFKFIMAGIHAGKVLTPNVGPGILHGNFEYAMEFFPFWQSYTPKFQRASCVTDPHNPGGIICSPLYTVGGTFTGMTLTPVIFRWNFAGKGRFTPWAQAAGGLLWTNHKYPAYGGLPLNIINDGPNADASVWNFTPQGGIGLHYFIRPNRSLDLSANGVHISSASLGDRNPGVNASVQFSLGYTWWK
jgi:lipid A 3-O-deacylase